jgi:hypothetical protein
METFFISDSDRALASLMEETEIGKNFHLIVSALTAENPKYWESLATFIDGLEEFKPSEHDLKRIIEVGENALLVDEFACEEETTEAAANFFIVFCLCYAFQNINKPFSYCIGNTILPSLLNLIDESTAPMLIRICSILKSFCRDIKTANEYGENAFALQLALKPLVFAMLQLDLSTMETLLSECLHATKEIFSLGDTPKEECNLLFELYTQLICEDEQEMVVSYALQCLSFFISRKNKYVNAFTEEHFGRLLELVRSQKADVAMNTANILSWICREKSLFGFFTENELPDILFDAINYFAVRREAAPTYSLLNCFLSLCENDHSLIPFFFEHEIFLSKCLMDLSTKVSNSVLEISCMAIDECGEAEPPFITDIEQIMHVIEGGLDSDDNDVLDDSLTLLRTLIEHGCEITDVRPQLEAIIEVDDPDILKEAVEILELLEEKGK